MTERGWGIYKKKSPGERELAGAPKQVSDYGSRYLTECNYPI